MSQSTLKLFINRLSTFVIIKNNSAPLYVRIAPCSLTLSNSAGFLWAIYIIATKQKTNTYKVNHRLLYDTACLPACLPACLISNLKFLTTLPGQFERCSSLSSPQSLLLSQILLSLIHLPFLHWNSPDKQSKDVVGAAGVVHVGVGRPMKET
jgi:hypothetical protein